MFRTQERNFGLKSEVQTGRMVDGIMVPLAFTSTNVMHNDICVHEPSGLSGTRYLLTALFVRTMTSKYCRKL